MSDIKNEETRFAFVDAQLDEILENTRVYHRQQMKKKLLIAGFFLLFVGSILLSFFMGRVSHVTSITIPYGNTYNIKDVKSVTRTPSGDTIVITYGGKTYRF